MLPTLVAVRSRLKASFSLGGLMPQSTIRTVVALLSCLCGLRPIVAQTPVPEFFIAVAPSVVNVAQGQQTSVTVTVTCNTSSQAAAIDCKSRPKFDFYLSEFPDGTSVDAAPGRVGANTISIGASSAAEVGSFPIQVTVEAGDTSQEQTFVLNIRQSPSAPSAPREIREPVGVQRSLVLTWEHHVLVAKTPEEFVRMANDLGRDSWELVSVITRQNAGVTEWIGFFKRPKR